MLEDQRKYFTFLIFFWDDSTCVTWWENPHHHYITPSSPSSSSLSSTCVNLERLGGPLCAPGPPARSQILLEERNSHQFWMVTMISLMTFDFWNDQSKSILSMKLFYKARCMDECVTISQKSRIMSAGSRKAPCSSSPTAVGPSGSSCLLLKCVKDLRVLFLLLLLWQVPGPLLSLARALATKKIQLQISKNRLLEFFGQLWKKENSESPSPMFVEILDLPGSEVSKKSSKKPRIHCV